MYGLKQDWAVENKARLFVLEDYQGGEPRWCPGCGDLAALTAVQRLMRDEQLEPENTVCVSGIGCSSRFPHYLKTYGFHGLHGRAFPVACGVKSRRPDLNVFVVTGDGDCTAIGAGHWIHAIRYNMNMTVLLLDNNIYGLTKKQTSPTTPLGNHSNTHPKGAPLEPLNPLVTVLGVGNVSFVAQAVDWNPAHLYATLQSAYRHKGFSFVRIIQRCPHYLRGAFDDIQGDTNRIALITGENSIPSAGTVAKMYKNHVDHDTSDIHAARELASQTDPLPIGLFYRNPKAACYDDYSAVGVGMGNAEKMQALESELSGFLI